MIYLHAKANESTAYSRIPQLLDSLNFNLVPNDSVRASIYCRLSEAYSQRNTDSAIICANEAMRIAQIKNYPVLLSTTYLQQGTNYVWAHKFDSAYSFLTNAIASFEKSGDHARLCQAYLSMASLYRANQIWDKAWQYTQLASGIYNSFGVSEKIQPERLFFTKATVYAGVNNISEALNWFGKAKNIFLVNGDKASAGNCFIEMSAMFMANKNNDAAKLYLDSALYLFNNAGESLLVAKAYKCYGDYFLSLNNADTAITFYNNALNIFLNSSRLTDAEKVKIGLGKAALQKQQLPTARVYAEEAYNFFKTSDDKQQRLETIMLLSEIDKTLGFKRRAYAYLDEYKTVSDSIKLLNNELRAKYSIQPRDTATITPGTEIISQGASNNSRLVNILISAGIVILLTSILLAWLYTQKNKALKEVESLHAETEQKNIELKKLHQEAEEKNKELGKINSIKDRLISMIAHDIRSPLASLQNTLTLTRENILNAEEFAGLSKSLEGDIYNLRGMLDNMLLWSREQVVEITVNKIPFYIDEVLNEIISMHHNNISLKNITIHNYLQDKLEVNSDKDMITAIFRNIFSNALKFTDKGKNIYIQQMMLNNKIYISVRDEGKGIPSEILTSINNREYTSTRGTANEKGTGIGLIFCQDLVQKLDETFDITTLPGKGTSVTFSVSYK